MTTNKQRKIDVVFLMDATSTMRPLFEHLRNGGMSNVLNMITEGGFDWRVAVWSYCNPQIGVHWLKRNPFVEKVEDVIAQLQGISADGVVNDRRPLLDALFSVSDVTSMPEDLEIDEVSRYNWRCGTPSRGMFRLVFVLTDGICFDNCLHNDSLLTLDDMISRFEKNRLWLQIAAPDYVNFDRYEDMTMINHAIYSPIPIQKNETGAHALIRYISSDLEDDVSKVLFHMREYVYNHEPLDSIEVVDLSIDSISDEDLMNLL